MINDARRRLTRPAHSEGIILSRSQADFEDQEVRIFSRDPADSQKALSLEQFNQRLLKESVSRLRDGTRSGGKCRGSAFRGKPVMRADPPSSQIAELMRQLVVLTWRKKGGKRKVRFASTREPGRQADFAEIFPGGRATSLS